MLPNVFPEKKAVVGNFLQPELDTVNLQPRIIELLLGFSQWSQNVVIKA